MSYGAVAQTVDTGFIGPDPQRAARILHQIADPDVGGSGRNDVFKGSKADAVEADQTGLGAEPQISVAGLEDRKNRGFRQALLHLPDSMHVLRQGSIRIEPVGRNRRQQQQVSSQSHAYVTILAQTEFSRYKRMTNRTGDMLAAVAYAVRECLKTDADAGRDLGLPERA